MELVKKGFKMTEVGVIPEDWEVVSLSNILDFKNGLNKESEYFGYGTPIINYMDVFNNYGIGKNDIRGKVFVNNQEQKNFSAKIGDVFFTRTSETQAEIGMSAVLLEEIPKCVFSGFVLRGRTKNNRISKEFKKYCFSPFYIRRQIISSSSYTTRALTNGRLLSQVKLTFPPTLTEQKAIATALSDVDALIHQLDLQISKKKAIKQGAMDRLLSGKGNIVEKSTLLEISSKIIDNRGKTPPNSSSGEVELVETASISFVNQYPDYSKVTKFVNKDTYENWFRGHPKKDDILISTVGEYSGASAIMKKNRGTIAQNLIAVRLKNVVPKYVFYWTKSIHYKQQLIQVMMNQAQPSLKVPWLMNFELFLPTLTEQTAIAEVLSDMDAEITALEKKRDKYKEIKQGMMQDLLTGKVRLV